MSSSSKLFFIILFLVIIASVFIYKGIGQEIKNRDSIPTPIPSIEPSLPKEEVLGDTVSEATSSAVQKDEGVVVTKVVDGDTIEVSIENKLYKVRFIGVDTPETVHPSQPKGCYGTEASNKTKELLNGKKVILEKDVSETDKYDRILRYVYLPLENGQKLFVNDYLVREGYAQVLTYPPDVKFNEQFLAAQRQAKLAKKGLWGKCY